MLFKKVKSNVLDHSEIKVLQWNYDGKGSCIASCTDDDGDKYVTTYVIGDIHETILDEEVYKLVDY